MQYPVPRVKICCISSVEEAAMAIRYGAAALGLVSEMPSGPGVISEQRIADIARTVPPGIATFLLTSRRDAAAIIAQQRRCGVNTLQLCDRLETGSHATIKATLPGVALVQVIHVCDETALDEARAVAPHVDALLLDSGNPNLTVKELGGTGRTHNWEISRRICRTVDRPVFLAGGLNPDNVLEALARVGPFGLDLCSGVREADRLNEAKLAAFFAKVRTF